jgi:creatinine amidohydrolase
MNDIRVRWAELRPDEFVARLDACPIALLPVGLCEPHGHVAALGLDLLHADYLCDQTARAHGGIVAPSQGYHVHESGYHARWLEDTVGEHNARMAAIPPHVLCMNYLYQLRAFAVAGFNGVLTVTGHGGGNERDLRLWGDAFSTEFGLPVRAVMAFELTPDLPGDHAGRREISTLLHLRPDLVDMGALGRQHEPGSGGRLALGEDAGDATAAYGAQVVAAELAALAGEHAALSARGPGATIARRISYAQVDALYRALLAGADAWVTARPWPDQPPVSSGSQWQHAERWQP